MVLMRSRIRRSLIRDPHHIHLTDSCYNYCSVVDVYYCRRLWTNQITKIEAFLSTPSLKTLALHINDFTVITPKGMFLGAESSLEYQSLLRVLTRFLTTG